MHPAYSVIFFTTLSGIGYGLASALALGLLPPTLAVALIGYALALVLITAGLLSSTAHLGHPERAWRAFSQWRTSWLSREGVLAVATYVPIGLAALGAVFLGSSWFWLGVVATLFAAATVYSTSMIYVSLKTVAVWHSSLTSLVFLAFAVAGGLVAAGAVAAVTGTGFGALYAAAAVLLVIAWALKAFWWQRADNVASPSTIESATGLGALGKVRLLERPHVTENYLNREMGYRVARKHAERLRSIALMLGAAVPAVALLIAALLPATGFGAALAALALPIHVAGMLVERWLFFAEAKHTVTLYYGASTA